MHSYKCWLIKMRNYCFWDKVLFRQTYCENIFQKKCQKSKKNRKNQQKCENENTRKTTKLVIIISNREHTLDVISKAFILFFGHVGKKWWFRVRHVIEIFRKNEPNFPKKVRAEFFASKIFRKIIFDGNFSISSQFWFFWYFWHVGDPKTVT